MTQDRLDPTDVDGVLAAFLDRLRAEGARPLPAGLEDNHIILMLEASSGAAKPRARRDHPTLRLAFRSLAVKLGAGAAVVLATGGALAATGYVPVVQDEIADALDFFVDLPGGSDDGVPQVAKPQSRPGSDDAAPSGGTRQNTEAGDAGDSTGSGESRNRVTGSDAQSGSGSDDGSSSGSSSTDATESDETDTTEPEDPDEPDTETDDQDEPPDGEEPDIEEGVSPELTDG